MNQDNNNITQSAREIDPSLRSMTNQEEDEYEESINIKITSSSNNNPTWPDESELPKDSEPEFNIDNMQSI